MSESRRDAKKGVATAYSEDWPENVMSPLTTMKQVEGESRTLVKAWAMSSSLWQTGFESWSKWMSLRWRIAIMKSRLLECGERDVMDRGGS